MYPSQRPQPHPYLVETVGVTIYYRGPADAAIRVKLPQGEFAFRPAELPESESIFPLRALVEVRRSPVVSTISESQYEDDYPSIAIDGSKTWVAWQAYQGKADRVFLRASATAAGRAARSDRETRRCLHDRSRGVARRRTVVWSEREGPAGI